ncbi:hypothetical protein [Streptomyces bacillaris]|uniref:hypothetical protein n=1 Tax=Streptomyces bacillaris TaxID=68179 RepID=UPI00296F61B3
MIVRFVGGPLAQRELETTDAPRFGGWFAVGAELALYVPVHRDAVTGWSWRRYGTPVRAAGNGSRYGAGTPGAPRACPRRTGSSLEPGPVGCAPQPP